jgi:hypothetical protein
MVKCILLSYCYLFDLVLASVTDLLTVHGLVKVSYIEPVVVLCFYSESEHLTAESNFFFYSVWCVMKHPSPLLPHEGGKKIMHAFEIRKIHVWHGEGIHGQRYFVLRKCVANTYRVLALTKRR